MKTQKKLLIIGLVWPEPETTAAGKRMMQLIALFQDNGFTITFVSTARQTNFSYPLKSLRIDYEQIAVNEDNFNDLIHNLDPALVMFDRFITEEQFGWRVSEICPNAVKLLDTEDLHCVRAVRKILSDGTINFTEVLLTHETTKREIASIFRCDLSLIISTFELNLLRKTFDVPEDLLIYVPFLLKEKETRLIQRNFNERSGFMSIGNLLHRPNLDSVRTLKREIWPKIRERLPSTTLMIYGAYMPNEVKQMHNPKTGFLIKGWAEELSEAFGTARVCLAPLTWGAGLKGKLVDAMIYGIPSVTTPIGAEGFGSLPWSGHIVSNHIEFADKAVALYTDEKQWDTAKNNGNRILKQEFINNSHGNDLLDRLAKIGNELHVHRQKNFIGAMLQHHSMKSTAYLGKWITLKNKKG
jgi:glycosyltransferase involved in cell wall biosynthesis